MSAFNLTTQIFINVTDSRLSRHMLESRTVEQFIKASLPLFRILDHADPAQSDIARLLWVIRSSIIFTPLQFSDPLLKLDQQTQELMDSAAGLPEAWPILDLIAKSIRSLLRENINPKRQWLIRALRETSAKVDEDIGIFYALTAGQAPGWPPEVLCELTQYRENLKLVRTRTDLKAFVFQSLILPCACRNAPFNLLAEAVHSGRAKRIDVLLYPGEHFQLPRRLALPECAAFRGRLKKTAWEYEAETVVSEAAGDPIESWVTDAFWSEMHHAPRTEAAHLIPARYALFADGTGTFLPEAGRISVLPDQGTQADTAELCLKNIDAIGEGDLIVLKAGDTEFMLDEASEQIMHDFYSDGFAEITTDWKSALEALLLTYSPAEISTDLGLRGVQVGSSTILRWSGPEVLGPGTSDVFRELIGLLFEKGKIRKPTSEMAAYISDRWQALQSLRGVRVKAGNLIRQNLLNKLFSQLGSGKTSFGDRTSIRLEVDGGVELLVMRVSGVDPKPAFVPSTRLCRIDDLRSNKWLK